MTPEMAAIAGMDMNAMAAMGGMGGMGGMDAMAAMGGMGGMDAMSAMGAMGGLDAMSAMGAGGLSETAAQINQLIQMREQARCGKDYAQADQIREQLTQMGVEVWDKEKTWKQPSTGLSG